ncbi:MAG: hypothetical protein ACYS8W_03650 [Planctomycetota bacterium]|jgi:hypothetical protein
MGRSKTGKRKPETGMWEYKVELNPAVREWLEEYAARYDTSRLRYIRFYYTKHGEINGTCRYPEGENRDPLADDINETYRISCGLPRRYPHTITLYCPPVYRGEDGSWPPVPAKCYLDKKMRVRRKGKPVWWMRIAMDLKVASLEEAAVYLFGHEFWHYLRETRQVRGRNTQTQADMFGLALLRAAQIEGAFDPGAGRKPASQAETEKKKKPRRYVQGRLPFK